MSSSTSSSGSDSIGPSSANTSQLAGASPPDAGQVNRWRTMIVCVMLASLVWVVFGQTRHFDFINFDDPTFVFQNPHLNHGLDWHELGWVFTHAYIHEWFPVTYASRMVDSQLYGINPGGPHLTNVFLHAATVVCLFLVLKQMTGAFWRAAFASAVFAIHPMRVESVAWVVERKDVLSGLFFMLTLWAWSDYVRHRPAFAQRSGGPECNLADPRRWKRSYLLALVFFTLGLLSKSILVTMPCLFLLLDFWPLGRLPAGGLASVRTEFRTWRGLILEKLPFVPLSLAACVATVMIEKNVMLTAQNTPLFWRVAHGMLAYTDYLKRFVYPANLALVYPFSNANPPGLTLVLCALLLLAITILAARLRVTSPWLLVGWAWYLGVFLPLIDSMQATQNSQADRYAYLPHIGLCIMVAWGGPELLQRSRYRQIILVSAALSIVAALTMAAYIQTGYWRNSVAVWTRSLACNPANYFAENTLGCALTEQGQWNAAIPHFEKSIQFNPNYAESRVNYGITLANLNRRTEAVRQLKLAIELNPNSDNACYNLGCTLVEDDKILEGIPYLKQAILLNPNCAKARYDLAVALATMGLWGEAIDHYEAAFGQKLELTDAQYITGVAFAAHGRWDDARELFERVVLTRPDSAEGNYHLGLVLVNLGQATMAAQHFQTALSLAVAQGDTVLADSIRPHLATNPPTNP